MLIDIETEQTIELSLDQVEEVLNKRLVQLLYQLDEPDDFGLEAWDAAYLQDSLLDVLSLTVTEEDYKEIWRERHGICKDTPTM